MLNPASRFGTCSRASSPAQSSRGVTVVPKPGSTARTNGRRRLVGRMRQLKLPRPSAPPPICPSVACVGLLPGLSAEQPPLALTRAAKSLPKPEAKGFSPKAQSLPNQHPVWGHARDREPCERRDTNVSREPHRKRRVRASSRSWRMQPTPRGRCGSRAVEPGLRDRAWPRTGIRPDSLEALGPFRLWASGYRLRLRDSGFGGED
nr:hypothetical protein Hi04_10k_c4246_00015 [uncultured bacterium]